MKELDNYGINLFSDEVMKQRIPNSIYRAFHKSLDENKPLSKETATVIANAMKIWAIEKGATHFTHWFTPLTGLTAEKHDAFLELEQDKPILEFSGKALRKGESDASSFPNGGLRATFEARGYTTWDATSPAFVKDGSLYIPTIFVSYNGEALDKKTPLLKSIEVLSKNVTELLHTLGYEDVKSVKPYVGVEQEYFLVDEKYYKKRIDLKLTGRTLFGAKAPKGQELEDHYYGSIKMRVAEFMKELDEELWKYGIPAKTKHNEAAPSQHEIACIYRDANITCDNNQLVMPLMHDIAKKNGLRCLLHEKPYSYVNGSGKHNNWSLVMDDGTNLFSPGVNPENNIVFLASIACMIKAVDEYQDLLRVTAAILGNDLRLGGNEAPPAIVSMFLGDDITELFESIVNGNKSSINKERFVTGVRVSSDFSKDTTDRNRTSPFAFTGNKFEFRMIGSSQSVATANTILNAIFAYEAKVMSEEIKAGNSVDDVIKKFYIEHKRILFNGDGYSKEWRIEAKKRGLKERKNAYEAIMSLMEPENVNALTSLGIYTDLELKSRQEILLENYAKSIHVEASTALMIARQQIYPCMINVLKDKSGLAIDLKELNLEEEYLLNDLKELNDQVSKLKKEIDELDKAINDYDNNNETTEVKAKIAREDLMFKMNNLRQTVDTLELMCDKDIWPLPNYVDLMFSI